MATTRIGTYAASFFARHSLVAEKQTYVALKASNLRPNFSTGTTRNSSVDFKPKSRRRIVVTGMGAVSPLGGTMLETWKRLIASGDSNSVDDVIISLSEALMRQKLPSSMFDIEYQLSKQLPCQIAAPASAAFDLPYDHRMNRSTQLALQATKDALEQAGLSGWFGLEDSDAESSKAATNIAGRDDGIVDDESVLSRRRKRCGVFIGSAMSSARQIFHATHLMLEHDKKGYRKLSPYFIPNCLSNSPAARVAIQYKLQGPNHSASTACAAGGHSIGDAYRCLLANSSYQEDCNEVGRGRTASSSTVDIMICGGTESCIDPISVAGFCRLNALATKFNDNPTEASRPFDEGRNGFVIAEGSAILILEDLDHAIQRNAKILAEIVGYSLTGDGYHVTSPDPSYSAAKSCMQQALNNFHEEETETQNDYPLIGYVNAHATSTSKGDEIEAQCIFDALQPQLSKHEKFFVSSTKGSTGHLLGEFINISILFQRILKLLGNATGLSLTNKNSSSTFFKQELLVHLKQRLQLTHCIIKLFPILKI